MILVLGVGVMLSSAAEIDDVNDEDLYQPDEKFLLGFLRTKVLTTVSTSTVTVASSCSAGNFFYLF